MKKNSTSRGYAAGRKLGDTIIEMVNLMYQNKTAAQFYHGLEESLVGEFERRHLTHKHQGEKDERRKS